MTSFLEAVLVTAIWQAVIVKAFFAHNVAFLDGFCPAPFAEIKRLAPVAFSYAEVVGTFACPVWYILTAKTTSHHNTTPRTV